MPPRKRPPKPKVTLAAGTDFNFRRYRPGDLIAISLAEIRREDRSRHLLPRHRGRADHAHYLKEEVKPGHERAKADPRAVPVTVTGRRPPNVSSSRYLKMR
jgi:hypothetical protein